MNGVNFEGATAHSYPASPTNINVVMPHEARQRARVAGVHNCSSPLGYHLPTQVNVTTSPSLRVVNELGQNTYPSGRYAYSHARVTSICSILGSCAQWPPYRVTASPFTDGTCLSSFIFSSLFCIPNQGSTVHCPTQKLTLFRALCADLSSEHFIKTDSRRASHKFLGLSSTKMETVFPEKYP